MRKLKLQMQVSIDGFVGGPNGEMDFVTMPWSADLDQHVTDLTKPVDTIVFGKNLAMGFIPYWASSPEGVDQETLDKFNLSKRFVFSNSMTEHEWENVELVSGDLKDNIDNIKSKQGGDIIVYGGSSFVASLLKENLIDEINLFINPTAMGKGMPIFNLLDEKKGYHLRDVKKFDCGIALLQYQLFP